MPILPKYGARMRQICTVLLSALVIITGICLIISCISIYRAGESPFTRARIAEHLFRIAPLFLLTLLAAVGGTILAHLFPPMKKRLSAGASLRDTVHRLSVTISLEVCRDDMRAMITRERKVRRLFFAINALLYAAGIIASLFYVCDQKNFPAENINTEIGIGMVAMLAGLAIPFAFTIILFWIFPSSYRREADLLRKAGANAAQAGAPFRRSGRSIKHCLAPKSKQHLLVAVRSVLILCSICFVILGITNGGMSAVVQKAIRICTECIGLG